jgi:hypothetical protein
MLAQASAAVRSVELRMLADLTDADQTNASRLLAKMAQALSDETNTTDIAPA